MRLRHIEGAVEIVKNHPLVNKEPKSEKGKWETFFGNDHPIYIEIGMGKGDFIVKNAIRYPDINFIGFEKFSGVLLRAIQKIEAMESIPSNLCLIRMDAIDILEVFEANEIQRVYLNFSDPWPKERWAKRRLTHRGYLKKYSHILKDDGMIQFKTDNDLLFEFSLEEIKESPYEIVNLSRDLHHSDYVIDNIMTEYESKFSAKGKTINFFRLEKLK